MLICPSGISVSACRKQENKRITIFATKEIINHLSLCTNYRCILQKKKKREILFSFQLAVYEKQKTNSLNLAKKRL